MSPELAELEGLIPSEVGEALADLAAEVPPELAIVELGSYKGKSACYLASRAQAHVWAVDAWDLAGNVSGRFHFNEARAGFDHQVRACGFEDRITAVRAFSEAAGHEWQGPPVGLLYIDADHSARAVRADFLAWAAHLASGASVAFDDLDTPRNPGVRVAVQQIAQGLTDNRVLAGRLAVGRYP